MRCHIADSGANDTITAQILGQTIPIHIIAFKHISQAPEGYAEFFVQKQRFFDLIDVENGRCHRVGRAQR